MELPDLLIIFGGIVLILLVLLDVFLAVLHIDISGIIAPRVFQAIWKSSIFLASAHPRSRRGILALAGPVMMVSIFLIWIGLFIVGFALIYWRNLSSFRSESEIGALGFVDALYYSGITGTVLGYGDISPITAALKVCAFIQSGLGFALLTGIVTYLLSVSTGVTQRNSLALHLAGATGGRNDGSSFVVRSLVHAGGAELPDRFYYLNHSLQGLHERMHQFPILDLFYRSKDPLRDPEPMLLVLAEISISGQILSRCPRFRALRPVAEELGWTMTNTMRLFARQYMGPDLLRMLENPNPAPSDRRYLEQIHSALTPLVDETIPSPDDDSREALLMTCRRRVFFEELDRFTRWRTDHDIAI